MSTEVRPICEAEADAFLELLCGVFGLDASQARHVFYTEPFFDLERKWALFQRGQMLSILTTTPLEFGWGRAIGIAGVATRKDQQGKGLATVLLEHVLEHSEAAGEGPTLLFAHSTRLYQRVGFGLVDEVVRGFIESIEPPEASPESLTQEQVQGLYGQWAQEHPDRLRRNARRWQYWSYIFRECRPIDGGYACLETGLCREALGFAPRESWPVPARTEWLGLRSMVAALEVPLRKPRAELMLLGYKLPSIPQMFMTDQF